MDPYQMNNIQMLNLVEKKPIKEIQNLEQDQVEDLSIASDIEHAILKSGDQA